MSVALLHRLSQEFGERFPRRLTGKQKEDFLKGIGDELGTRSFQTEQIHIRHWGFHNRLLITKCEKPKVIFMAHYDTPTIMPPGFSLIYQLFGHTRQGISAVFAIALLIALFSAYSWLENLVSGLWATAFLILMMILFVIPFFFPNPHNSEDNTSGVLGLLALADWAKEQQYKDSIQFVFLDNEEWGLVGSNALKTSWGKTGHLDSETVIINLDCVSRGEKPLIIHHRNDHIAQEVYPYLQRYLPQTEIFDMKSIPLSDNYTFRNQGAIDISYGDPAVIPGGYFIPKVHTPWDNEFYPEQTAMLINGLADYLHEKLSAQ